MQSASKYLPMAAHHRQPEVQAPLNWPHQYHSVLMAMPMLLFLEVQTHTSWLRHFKKPSLSPIHLPHCLTSGRHSLPDLETPDCGHPIRGCRPPSPRSQKHSWSAKKLCGIPAEHWAVPARLGGSVVTPLSVACLLLCWTALAAARERGLDPNPCHHNLFSVAVALISPTKPGC